MNLLDYNELELEVILAFPERNIQKGSWKCGASCWKYGTSEEKKLCIM